MLSLIAVRTGLTTLGQRQFKTKDWLIMTSWKEDTQQADLIQNLELMQGVFVRLECYSS
jgi:hypothetical protein